MASERSNSRIRIGIIGFLGAAGITVGFQNCGDAGFELINQTEKAGFLIQNTVFGNKTGTQDDGGGVNTTISVEGEGGVAFPVKNYCSTYGWANQKRVVESSEIFLEVKDQTGTVICDEHRNQFRSLIDTKSFRVSSSCMAKMTAGKSYSVRLYEPSEKAQFSIGSFNASFLNASVPALQFKYTGEMLTMNSGIFYVLYSKNPDLTSGATGEYPDECDVKSSPLVALIGDGSKSIELTSPAAGVRYDIQGENAKPAAHAKKRISWFLNKDHNYYFIALPNANGEVKGINELFGDNTKGPDGKFAANGYAALAKYDDNRDGYITKDDAIFTRLRMWQDRSLDGVSSSEELFTLNELGVSVIDLRFDKGFREIDAFGNETRMKSVIRTTDGKLHLLFDLWFRQLD